MTPGGRTDDESAGWSNWLRGLALGLLVVLVVVEGLDRLVPEAGETAEPRRPDISRWELLGCWELGLDPWRVTPSGTASRAREAPLPPRADVATDPPELVMLLPDSVDPWGRTLDSYRAVVVGDASSGGEPLRWIVRADTLWLLWSGDGSRGGVALRRTDGHLTGRARAVSDSVDASARAEAWRLNCSTLERTEPPAFRR